MQLLLEGWARAGWRRRGLSGGGHACTCAPRTGSGGGSHAHLHPCRLMILHVQRWRQRQLDDLAKGGGAGGTAPALARGAGTALTACAPAGMQGQRPGPTCSARPLASVAWLSTSSASREMACCGRATRGHGVAQVAAHARWGRAQHGPVPAPATTRLKPRARRACGSPSSSVQASSTTTPARQSRQSCRCGRWCRHHRSGPWAATPPSAGICRTRTRRRQRQAGHGRAWRTWVQAGSCPAPDAAAVCSRAAASRTCTPSMRRSQPSISCRLRCGLRLGCSKHSSAGHGGAGPQARCGHPSSGSGHGGRLAPARGRRAQRALPVVSSVPSPSTWKLPPSMTMGHSKRVSLSICAPGEQGSTAGRMHHVAGAGALCRQPQPAAPVGRLEPCQSLHCCPPHPHLTFRMVPASAWSLSQHS